MPPAVLYHGTTHRALLQILQDGLKPMQRQYVHLSIDVETATRVGKRRDSEPVILNIDTEAAQKAGIQFYIGNDKVWLCNRVPKECITV
nr:RNA 2'-phosphotransferase [uncultured Fibrobacter sp.]